MKKLTQAQKIDAIYKMLCLPATAPVQPKPKYFRIHNHDHDGTIDFEVYDRDIGVMTFVEAEKAAKVLYSDGLPWRVPTSDELNEIYKNKGKIEGLNLTGSEPAGWYWSSSPFNIIFGRGQRFSDGSQYYDYSSDCLSVRLVRSLVI